MKQSKNKHTPGPWLIDATQPHIHIGSETESVCWIHRPTQPSHPGSLINARLIAAAPEMLEALEECRELLKVISNKLGHITQSTDCDTLRARELIRMAITKARGES